MLVTRGFICFKILQLLQPIKLWDFARLCAILELVLFIAIIARYFFHACSLFGTSSCIEKGLQKPKNARIRLLRSDCSFDYLEGPFHFSWANRQSLAVQVSHLPRGDVRLDEANLGIQSVEGGQSQPGNLQRSARVCDYPQHRQIFDGKVRIDSVFSRIPRGALITPQSVLLADSHWFSLIFGLKILI